MRLRSSANIELFSYSLLVRACKVRKISLSKMISFIIRNAVMQYDFNNQLVLFRNVKYQPKGLEYKLIHFYFEAEEYESCLDIRKLGKVSVSSILNIWIKKFVGKLLSERKTTNLEFELDNYAISYFAKLMMKDSNIKFLIEIRRTAISPWKNIYYKNICRIYYSFALWKWNYKKDSVEFFRVKK